MNKKNILLIISLSLLFVSCKGGSNGSGSSSSDSVELKAREKSITLAYCYQDPNSSVVCEYPALCADSHFSEHPETWSQGCIYVPEVVKYNLYFMEGQHIYSATVSTNNIELVNSMKVNDMVNVEYVQPNKERPYCTIKSVTNPSTQAKITDIQSASCEAKVTQFMGGDANTTIEQTIETNAQAEKARLEEFKTKLEAEKIKAGITTAADTTTQED
ncbi:MAG: hypothetical protein HQK51_13890 [Oligoflexia bacterium]|nr:hypothetical protein [Oligoflexia bacterium]